MRTRQWLRGPIERHQRVGVNLVGPCSFGETGRGVQQSFDLSAFVPQHARPWAGAQPSPSSFRLDEPLMMPSRIAERNVNSL